MTTRSTLRRCFAAAIAVVALALVAPSLSAEPASAAGANASAARVALSQVGKPYHKNATGPRSFDCSGLVAYAYSRIGKSVPHSSSGLNRLHHVSLKSLQPGDIVGRPGHVGIYIGGGRMVHAAAPGKGVRVDPIGKMRWAVRP
jgi:peptidoglycan DL-endopeptidase CwlO